MSREDLIKNYIQKVMDSTLIEKEILNEIAKNKENFKLLVKASEINDNYSIQNSVIEINKELRDLQSFLFHERYQSGTFNILRDQLKSLNGLMDDYHSKKKQSRNNFVAIAVSIFSLVFTGLGFFFPISKNDDLTSIATELSKIKATNIKNTKSLDDQKSEIEKLKLQLQNLGKRSH